MRLSLIRRKDLVNAGISNSQLIHLSERNKHFKNRPGDHTFFIRFDALLVFIASKLFDFLPFRNVSHVVDDLVELYPDLYARLQFEPKQFLIIEELSNEEMEKIGIELSWYMPRLRFTASLPLLDWENRKAMILINLEKIFRRVEDLFERQGFVISDENLE